MTSRNKRHVWSSVSATPDDLPAVFLTPMSFCHFSNLHSPRTELRLISINPHLGWLSPIFNPSHATVKTRPIVAVVESPPFHPVPTEDQKQEKNVGATPPTISTCYVIAHKPQLPGYRRGGQGPISGPRVGQAPICQFSTQSSGGVTETSTHY